MTTVKDQAADWCVTEGSLAICGTRVTVHSRAEFGLRWCFHCRKREMFEWVVYVPDGMSYYGPEGYIEAPTAECTDLFPGWSRECDQ